MCLKGLSINGPTTERTPAPEDGEHMGTPLSAHISSYLLDVEESNHGLGFQMCATKATQQQPLDDHHPWPPAVTWPFTDRRCHDVMDPRKTLLLT